MQCPDVCPGLRLASLALTLNLTAACGDMAQPPATAPDASAVEIETHRWSTRVRAGDGVTLINRLGDLRARASGDAGLHYVGVVQKLAGELRDANFGTQRLPGGMQIEASAPDGWNGRVDASARVPDGSLIDLSTDDGLIEVRTGDNDVVAVSRAGRISVRTNGRIEARGETGDMLIVLFGTGYGEDDAGRIETISGNIELWIQPGADVTVDAEAGAGMDIDVGDAGAVTYRDPISAQVSIGRGGSRLFIRSQQGSLVIRALPQNPGPDPG